MKPIRIFISSPGDVVEERERAKSVVQELRRRYAGRLDLRAVLWEDLPLQADMSFQQGIDLVLSEHGVDVAIFILWSRLGSPVGALIRKPDGATYRSGTEREWDLMWRARDQSGGERPRIMVYTRIDEPSFDERLRGLPTDEKEQVVRQKKLVEQFIAEEFHDAASGTNLRAHHSFDRPTTFAQRLRIHLQELLDPLTGGDLASPVWDITKNGPPFLGLDAFEFEHAPVFFGREDEIVAVRQLLREQARRGCAFALITGASGSGKSSLARAGVLPAVATHEIDCDVAGWRIAILTPTESDGDLLLTLTQALSTEGALPAVHGEPESLARLAADLRRDPELVCRLALRPAMEAMSKRLLVLVDQLEELFTDRRITGQEADAFARALEALARSGCAWVLATVRSDFYAECQSLEALVKMKEGGGQFDLVPPGADALDRLIRQPAALAGLRFEQRGETSLADVIVRDATSHRELLPLLEYLLHRLCAERTEVGLLTFDKYEALGGVEGALAARADAVVSEVRPTAATLDALLAALVTPDREEQERFVRRRVPRVELERDEASATLVSMFIRERLLTSSAIPGGPALITVAHEALFRVWPPAIAWYGKNREFVAVRNRVAERLLQWCSTAVEKDEQGIATSNASFLLQPGRELDDARKYFAERFYDFKSDERAFIAKSIECAEEKAWIASLTAGGNDEMLEHWNRMEKEYASMRERVLADRLINGSASERRHAAQVLGMSHLQPLTEELARLVVADQDIDVRRAAAAGLIRLDDVVLCKMVADQAMEPGEQTAAREAMAQLLVAGDMQFHAPRFEAWFLTLPTAFRRQVLFQSWSLRLNRAVPVFFAVVIPAMVLAGISTMAYKWLPGIFNYGFGQAKPSAGMAIFHGAVASVLIGGASAFGLTSYRMVFGREHGQFSIFRPFGAIVSGAVFGALGGALCDLAVAGVFLPEGLQIMGWISEEATVTPPLYTFFSDLLFGNFCGWVFILNGAGVGIGTALMTNKMRGLDSWREFLHRRSAFTLSSLRQVGDTLRELIRLGVPHAWPIPVVLFITSLLGFGLLELRHDKDSHNDQFVVSTFLGGVSSKSNLGRNSILENRRLRAWKMSRFGRAAGIAGDASTKALGAFFVVVGMGFGIVVLGSGINVEAWKKIH